MGVLNFGDEPGLKSKISACGLSVRSGRREALLGITRGSCFDVGVADPTRHGYLPTGNRFFKRAQAAERYAGKKKAAYAALVWQHSLKKKVGYAPVIFEVSDGFLDSVSQLPSKATEVAGKNKVKLAAADWPWSAMDWSLFHAQVLSFEINKITALVVLSSLRSAVAAVEAAN